MQQAKIFKVGFFLNKLFPNVVMLLPFMVKMITKKEIFGNLNLKLDPTLKKNISVIFTKSKNFTLSLIN